MMEKNILKKECVYMCVCVCVCVCITESLCYVRAINNIVNQLYFSENEEIKK